MDVYCSNVVTGHRLNPNSLHIISIDNSMSAKLPTQPATATTQSPSGQSVPLPATDNPFPDGYVTTEMVNTENFKVFSQGTVYGFSHAPNGTYQMVFVAQFSNLDSLNKVEHEAVDVFVKFVPEVTKHVYKVTGNATQTAEAERCEYSSNI
jgi:hypothetical protein